MQKPNLLGFPPEIALRDKKEAAFQLIAEIDEHLEYIMELQIRLYHLIDNYMK